MQMLVEENKYLQEKLVAMYQNAMVGASSKAPSVPELSNFMKLLLECASKNAGKKKNAWRFVDLLKEIGLVVYSMGNLQVYEFLSANLPLPSISTVRRIIYQNDVIIEGKFRIKELKEYLTERNYPFKVLCSEDATVVIKRLEYHAPSNQIIGNVLPLDKNGLPVPNSYPATSAQAISECFKKEMSHYLYCIMIQPLAPNSDPFCVAIFGTNNQFTAAQVHLRWNWTYEALLAEGIIVVSNAGDGDSRLLKTMRHIVFDLKPNPNWPWFQAVLKPTFLCIQDHIHVGVKLKTRLLKPSIVLPMGPFKTVSRGHLVELITQTQTRDQHLLCLSDINPKDKMNFKALQKMSDPKVSSLLRKEVKDSEATSTYLELMNQVVAAYTQVDLLPLQRIEMIWEWVFFLRMWRAWVSNSEGYTLQNNFITLNSYCCIELNAHAIIQYIVWFRDQEDHSAFLPWLLSSQVCESTFRALRSPKVTGSGVTCFTVLDAKNFFRRLDTSIASQNRLQDFCVFPRHKKQMKTSKVPPHIPVCLPENYEIEAAIKVAHNKAVARALEFNLIKSRPKRIPAASLQTISKKKMQLPDDEDEDGDCDAENITNCESDNETNENESEPDYDNEENDLMEDLFIASAGPIHLKTYEVANLPESSPFVKVLNSEGEVSIIKKSALCWLLRSENSKISSDRLQRVQEKLNTTINTHHTVVSHPSREEDICVGEWCAFKFEDGSIGVGRILAFSYLSGTSLKHQEYSKLEAPVSSPTENARGLGCLCTWFTIKKNELVVTQMDVHGYYNINNYVCSIPRPKVVGKKLLLRCSISQIKAFL